MPSRDFLISVKPSIRQWNEILGPMSPGRRSAYIRTAIEAYMEAEQPSVLRYIPLDLDGDPDEPIRHIPIQAVGTATIEQWMAKLPGHLRSHLLRYIIKWYTLKLEAENERQPKFDLEAASIQRTGTDT